MDNYNNVKKEPVETHSGMPVEIDNSPRGSLRSLLGAMNLDAAKPWVDEAINEVISSQRKELIEKIEGMKKDTRDGDPDDYGYNVALTDVLNLIKNND